MVVALVFVCTMYDELDNGGPCLRISWAQRFAEFPDCQCMSFVGSCSYTCVH